MRFRELVMMMMIAACGRSAPGEPGAHGSPPAAQPPAQPAAQPARADASAAVNALVPEDLRSRLHFSQRTLEHRGHRFTLPVPDGWADGRGTGDGNLVWKAAPTHQGPPYFPSSLTVHGEACGGEWTGRACSDAPAAEQTDELYDGMMKDSKVVAQAKTDGERTLTISDQFAVTLARAWWKPGDKRFSYCTAGLIDPLRPAAKAFEAACAAVVDEK